MTLSEILHAAWRRWYVVVVVLVVAAGMTAVFLRDGGVYSTKTIVSFTLPSASVLAQDNGNTDESVIAFAGSVAAEINDGKPTPRYSTNDAPYYGAGIRQGIVVGLRDDGSQWAPSYGRAVIEIQIVGRSAAWVRTAQSDILNDIERIVTDQQAAAAAAADEQITAHVDRLTMRIEYISASRSSTVAAVGAIGLAVVIVGSWLVVVIDRNLRRRNGRRRLELVGGQA